MPACRLSDSNHRGDKNELRMSGFRGVPNVTRYVVQNVSCSQSVTLTVQVRAVSSTGKTGDTARLQRGFPCVPEERLRAPQSLRLSIENNDDLRVSGLRRRTTVSDRR